MYSIQHFLFILHIVSTVAKMWWWHEHPFPTNWNLSLKIHVCQVVSNLDTKTGTPNLALVFHIMKVIHEMHISIRHTSKLSPCFDVITTLPLELMRVTTKCNISSVFKYYEGLHHTNKQENKL
jgi:hypothetical protein